MTVNPTRHEIEVPRGLSYKTEFEMYVVRVGIATDQDGNVVHHPQAPKEFTKLYGKAWIPKGDFCWIEVDGPPRRLTEVEHATLVLEYMLGTDGFCEVVSLIEGMAVTRRMVHIVMSQLRLIRALDPTMLCDVYRLARHECLLRDLDQQTRQAMRKYGLLDGNKTMAKPVRHVAASAIGFSQNGAPRLMGPIA